MVNELMAMKKATASVEQARWRVGLRHAMAIALACRVPTCSRTRKPLQGPKVPAPVQVLL